MSNLDKATYDDEIDLLELIENLWHGKFIILGVTSAFLLGGIGYQYIAPKPSFVATTVIEPISSVEAERYNRLNALEFFNVTPDLLSTLYVEQLQQREVIASVLNDFNFLQRDDFIDEIVYNQKLLEEASSVRIFFPTEQNDVEGSIEFGKWHVSYETNDEELWLSALRAIHEQTNNLVREILRQRFEDNLNVATQMKEFELEDLRVQIQNLRDDYARVTLDRLAYLREQAAIARQLNVANNTLEAQLFDGASSTAIALNAEVPFYLRGYEAIEKEIDLIESRTDATPFISGLLELEQQERDYLQDRTLQRARELFNNTPVVTTENFLAANILAESTVFQHDSNRNVIVALMAILGAFIGSIYVLIAAAIKKRTGIKEK